MAPAGVDWVALSDQLLSGDAAAFIQFSRLVRGFLIRMRAYDFREEWPDLIQEVLAAVVVALREGRLRERAALVGYVRTVTRNKFMDRLRQHLRRHEDEETPWEELFAEAQRLEPPRKDASEVLELRQALSKLPSPRAMCLVLVYGQGKTYEETAAETGIPLGTVKAHLREGLAELRSSFEVAHR